MPMTDHEFEQLREADPFALFDEWMAAADKSEPVDPNAMTLATVGPQGMPQARTVLLKSASPAGFIFYTNTGSRKGEALKRHPQAALLFYWKTLGRQILAEGTVEQLSAQRTQAYYDTRPRGSRLGAWASQQSRPIPSIAALRAQIADTRAKFEGKDPPLPPHWRGYLLSPQRLEFWQQGEHRLHQRIAFTREAGGWQSEFLQP